MVLAVVHASHLDPLVVSTVYSRRVGWMSRIEFYGSAASRAFLQAIGAFAVDRRAPGLSPVREAARRLAAGEVVGIFPEGEIATGSGSVCRGGEIKDGAMYLSALTGCAVVPVLVLGSHTLTRVGPWMPARRGRLWVRVGRPLSAGSQARRQPARRDESARLADGFRALFTEARDAWNLPEDVLP